MDDTNDQNGHSAEVSIWLDCGEHGSVPLSQAAPTFVIATEPVSLPACNARLVMMVDGRRAENAVRLVNGMDRASRNATICLDVSVPPF